MLNIEWKKRNGIFKNQNGDEWSFLNVANDKNYLSLFQLKLTAIHMKVDHQEKLRSIIHNEFVKNWFFFFLFVFY